MSLLKIVIATMFDYIGYIGNFLITGYTTNHFCLVTGVTCKVYIDTIYTITV